MLSVGSFAIKRGNVKLFRSDRGTNFIGATDKLNIEAINVEDGPVKHYLYKNGTIWVFNPPHASHMGGVWERMIGVTRRILDSMLTDVAAGKLTNEVPVTLMAEGHSNNQRAFHRANFIRSRSPRNTQSGHSPNT